MTSAAYLSSPATRLSRVAVAQPETLTSVRVAIPPNTSDYEQSFSPVSLSIATGPEWYSFINSAEVGIDTSGLWNIPTQQLAYISRVGVKFDPGFWDRTAILEKMNETPAGSNFLTIPERGPGAFHSHITKGHDVELTPLLSWLLGGEGKPVSSPPMGARPPTLWTSP